VRPLFDKRSHLLLGGLAPSLPLLAILGGKGEGGGACVTAVLWRWRWRPVQYATLAAVPKRRRAFVAASRGHEDGLAALEHVVHSSLVILL
jgi:hypothetical protein